MTEDAPPDDSTPAAEVSPEALTPLQQPEDKSSARKPLPSSREPELWEFIRKHSDLGEPEALQKAQKELKAKITRKGFRVARANAGTKKKVGRPAKSD